MNEYYKLNKDHVAVPCTVIEFEETLRDCDGRRVALDEGDGVSVSTVFLGLDHSWGDGPPMLFETMIFGGEHDEDQWRYSTWGEAVAGHKVACKIAGINATPSEAS